MPTQDPFSREAVRIWWRATARRFLVIDAERVRRQYQRLSAALPGVDLHYALKPLPHASVIDTLNAQGSWFDLATNGEVELVRRLGVAPERCIHTHPIKRDGDIRTALSLWRKPLRHRQSGRAAQVRQISNPRFAAGARFFPQSRSAMRFVAKIRL